jgi:hypothetical protein
VVGICFAQEFLLTAVTGLQVNIFRMLGESSGRWPNGPWILNIPIAG